MSTSLGQLHRPAGMRADRGGVNTALGSHQGPTMAMPDYSRPDLPCRQPGADPDDWTAEPRSAATQRAKTACQHGRDGGPCPLLEQCLAWALAVREPWCTYGGMDSDERRKLLGARRRRSWRA
jgi:Transcription factor WhiB